MDIPQKKTGLKRIIAALFFSLDGLRIAFSTQTAFRQEIAIISICSPIAFFVGDSIVEKILLLSSLLLVLMVELINSAVESAIDRIGPEAHELSKFAKDFASAAVFIAILNAVLIWTLIIAL